MGAPRQLCQLQLLSVPSPHTYSLQLFFLPLRGSEGPSTTLYPNPGPALSSSKELRMVISGHWSRDPEHQEPPDEAGRGATQALGQEEGPFPSRPPPLWVSSECGNARHVPGQGTQVLFVPTPRGRHHHPNLCPLKVPS